MVFSREGMDMKIGFIENEMIINRDQHIPLGKLTCDMLNDHGWNQQRLLEAQLVFFQPMEDTKVSDFLARIEGTERELNEVRERIKKYRYYDMNDEAVNTFVAIEDLLESTRRQVEQKMHTGDELVNELGIEIDEYAWERASKNYSAFWGAHAEAVRVFSKLVDTVMIRNDAYPQRKPMERLHAFGFDRFQKRMHDLMQEFETAASSAYAPDFEMIELPDGSITMTQVVSINNVAQLMYHELMNMIMQGHSIRKCKNCGKYFVQYGDRVVDYCDEIPEGETKPCSVIGSSRQFTASLKDDPIKQTYTRVYKKYVARRRMKTITEGQFATWSAEAKKLRTHAYKTGMNEETFRDMLDELMVRITGE